MTQVKSESQDINWIMVKSCFAFQISNGSIHSGRKVFRTKALLSACYGQHFHFRLLKTSGC